MSFGNSPGVYNRIEDQSFVVSGGGVIAGGIVVSAKRGPTEVNVVTSAKQFIRQYGLPSRDNPSLYCALRFLNRAGILSVRRVINDATLATGDLPDPNSGPVPHLTVEAANEGAWGNAITVEFATIVGAPTGVFGVVVKEDGQVVEQFSVSRDPDAKNGYGNNIFIEDVINNQSEFIQVQDNPTITAPYNMSAVINLSGGADDTVAPTSGDIMTAWDEFKNEEDVEAQLLINAGWTAPSVQSKMLEVADTRFDAYAILDVPQSAASSIQDMIDYRNTQLGADTYFGGLYGGWLKVYDQYNDREVTIPPSGDVAAAFVDTATNYERWDAPAGMRRGVIPSTLGVTKVMNEGERDMLYNNGINPVTSFPGVNAVIFGQKSLQMAASALDRANVVMSLLWINERMKEALKPFVFEPNTEYTRNAVNFLLSSFLESIQVRGGLYGFAVDTSTDINTPQAIDNNELMVDVYVQPVKTAEYVRVSTIVTRTGVSLSFGK